MIDIVAADASGLMVFDSLTPRAANILSVQLDSLEYLPDFGIDLQYFLNESVEFQNDSFKSYLIQVLASYGINVASVQQTIENLFESYIIEITGESNSTGLIAR